jgi:hypothetical protein
MKPGKYPRKPVKGVLRVNGIARDKSVKDFESKYEFYAGHTFANVRFETEDGKGMSVRMSLVNDQIVVEKIHATVDEKKDRVIAKFKIKNSATNK